MKVLMINGSPHVKGNTKVALEEMVKIFHEEGIETEIFWIGKKVQGCIGCCQCQKTGKCILGDDSVAPFLEKAKVSDGFVFGSAVYYGSATGSIISFMDRVFFSGSKYLQDKPVASVVSCRRGGGSETFVQMNMYYTMNNMPVVSSQYWNQVHGFTAEDVEKDKEGLQTMRTLAVNMGWLLRCIEAANKQGIPMPHREEQIFTHFIR